MARKPDGQAADAARWSKVDEYFGGLLLRGAPDLEQDRSANAAAGLPAIDVSPLQGRMLGLLVRISGARRILEIGTLGGYSTLCMAQALPEGGKIVTLEIDARHAAAARRNFAAAGASERIELIEGRALDVLPRLTGPFDLVFIDADKPNNPHYLDWAVRLSRPGTVIVCDNVVRGGAVADAHSTDASVRGTRAMAEAIADDPRLSATAVQTVGEKGWDGFVLARVNG